MQRVTPTPWVGCLNAWGYLRSEKSNLSREMIRFLTGQGSHLWFQHLLPAQRRAAQHTRGPS